jgi:DNA-binding NarL/FixJ family response regulator
MHGGPSRPKKARILLVDDHPLIRERLAEVLEREPDIEVCGEAEDRHEALELVSSSRPDLVIVDLTLKSSHGLDLIKDLRVRSPELPALVVSMHDESLHAERALRAGARGYITKQEATRKILLAVRTVLAGDVYLSERLAARIATIALSGPALQSGPAITRLTDRELRVFELIGQGRSTRQIAAALYVDMSTVETYRARIKDKLKLRNASELLQHAIRWTQGGK